MKGVKRHVLRGDILLILSGGVLYIRSLAGDENIAEEVAQQTFSRH